KNKIVISKYIYSIICALLMVASVTFLNYIIPSFKVNSVKEIVITIGILMLMISMYYPIYYLLGPRYYIPALVIIFIGMYITVSVLGNTNHLNRLITFLKSNFSEDSLFLFPIIFVILCFLLSLWFSNIIYNSKNL